MSLLTQTELRMNELLLRKEEKLSFFLKLLKLQAIAIRAGDTEKLAIYSEMVRETAGELESLRKVFLPLESLSRKSYPSGIAAFRLITDGFRGWPQTYLRNRTRCAGDEKNRRRIRRFTHPAKSGFYGCRDGTFIRYFAVTRRSPRFALLRRRSLAASSTSHSRNRRPLCGVYLFFPWGFKSGFLQFSNKIFFIKSHAEMKEPVYLLDSYSVIYRSYFAFMRRPLRNPEGRNTSAVFGFFRTLFSLFQDRNPVYFGAVFDSIGPTFRHDRYEQYKATRDKTPDDLHEQVPVVEEILAALGMPLLRVNGFEADDIIATYAEACAREGRQCYVISGDKDLLQLVGPSTSILKPDQGGYHEMKRPDVIEEWGVAPEQIVDLLSLMGDQSDNVPGVQGIGAKTAAKLLGDFETLDGVYENLDALSSASQRQKLESGRESAYLSKELVTLRKDVPMEFSLEDLKLAPLDAAKSVPLFMREGIRSLADELVSGRLVVLRGSETVTEETGVSSPAASVNGAAGEAIGEKRSVTAEFSVEALAPEFIPTGEAGAYEAVTSVDALDAWIEKVKRSTWFAFDLEADAIDALSANPVGFSLSVQSGEACYIPLRAAESECIPEETVKERLRVILEDESLRLIGQNIKYDYKVLRRWGIRIKNIAFDTMVAAWLLESDQMLFNLDKLAEQYLNYRTVHFEDVVPKGLTFDTVELPDALRYAAEDADITFRLYEVFSRELENRGFTKLFREIEIPLIVLLAEMELTGIKLNSPVLAAFEKELELLLANIEEEIFRLCGKIFNINSTKQLQTVLFVERKLRTVKKTKTGYSTDTSVLEELAHEDPVPQKVLQHRLLSKLKSTYVTALPKLVNAETGRLHTHFVQTGTATGRLSSRDPNLQNIPIRDEEGRRIRSAFIPDGGTVFMSADYSQIELVVLAHLTQDPGLMSAFTRNQDVHRQTAAILFGVVPGLVTPEQRRIAKTINFGVMYGMSAFRLSRELGIPRAAADRFISAYFTKYAKIQDFMDSTIAEAEKTGVVKTLLGRERRVPAITSRNKTVKSAAERVAVNTPIQGTAADIVKTAMIRVSRRLESEGCRAKLLLQVHDELILEVP